MGINERKEKERLIRRNDVIEAAEELFVEKGYEHTTMDDIAKKSEFTKKTIYTYFSSKDELYYEIMLKGFEKLNQLIDIQLKDHIIDSTIKESGLEKIKLLGSAFIDFSLKYPFYYRAITDYENKEFEFNQSDRSELIEKYYVAGQYSTELLETFVKEGILGNEIIDSSDPKIIALVLWSSVTGLIGLISRKEKYIAAHFNSNTSLVLEEGFAIILNSIKK